MSKVLCCFAPGLEACEGLVSVDLLRRAGIDVTIASVWEERRVVGAHGVAIECDALLTEVDCSGFDALLLPGGMPGTENLFESEIVRALASDYAEAGRIVAVICAAPTVLGRLGLLKGRRATCYPGCEENLFAGEHVLCETDAELCDTIPYEILCAVGKRVPRFYK